MFKKSILLMDLAVCLIISETIVAEPAPSLTDLQVCAVKSANYPRWDYVAPSEWITKENHGGPWLVIVTEERGYATPSSRSAKMNGYVDANKMRWTERDLKIIHEIPILDSWNKRTVIGWWIFWDASGFQGGTFTCQSTGITYPWRTLRDRIEIR